MRQVAIPAADMAGQLPTAASSEGITLSTLGTPLADGSAAEKEQERKTAAAASVRKLRSNFRWFAVLFASNHAVATTPLVIATSVLDQNAGYFGNALLNVFSLISSFFLAAPIVAGVGLKRGVLVAMSLYSVYATLFALAALIGSGQAASQYLLFCIGSMCGGLGAGVLWTAQGPYLARTIDLIQEQDDSVARATLTSELWGVWGLVFLGLEVVAKLLWSLLDYVKLEGWIIAGIFAAVGVLSTALMAALALDLKAAAQAQQPFFAKAKAAFLLWRDPVIFCLAGSNLTFGFCAAFMNGFVNANYAKVQLGAFAVAMLSALTALVAAIASRLLAPVSAAVGKGPVVVFGAMCFLLVPLSVVAFGNVENWGWVLVVLYILQGMGRGVYESTNKGVFGDFFPDQAVGAFANCMGQVTFSFALCFFLSTRLTGFWLEIIIFVLAGFTPVGYAAASCLRRRQEMQHREFQDQRV